MSERFGATTLYNIDSACVSATGVVHHRSQLAVMGVLWVEYAVAAFAIIAVLVWVIRGLRGPPRSDGPADLVST